MPGRKASSKTGFRPSVANRAKIWHYTDFTNLVAMLEDGGLYFTRADRLNDRFEGSMSLPLKAQVVEGKRMTAERYSRLLRQRRRESYVHCWHMSDIESAAMWQLYSSNAQSVSIQSTYQRLRKALEKDIRIGAIRYIAYDKDRIPFGDPAWPLFHKRKSFEHERELRAIFWMDKAAPGKKNRSSWLSKTDLELIIETIYVSPWSSDWFTDLVRKVVKRYRLNIPVHRSVLDQEPLL